MNIKLICKKENYEKYSDMLIKGGFNISDDSELLFRELQYEQRTIVGVDNKGASRIIKFNDIYLIESFAHKVILHTRDEQYSIREKLYEIEGIFEDDKALRINKSQIVSREKIFKVVPQYNSRLKIILKNNLEVYVTRIYLNNFRKKIGV